MAAFQTCSGLIDIGNGGLEALHTRMQFRFYFGQNAIHLPAGTIAAGLRRAHTHQSGQIFDTYLGAGQADNGTESFQLFLTVLAGSTRCSVRSDETPLFI